MNSLFNFALIALLFTSTGCVASKYKRAPKTIPPAVVLRLPARSDNPSRIDTLPLQAVIQSVIAYQGPGSWKRAAYWDEYVLSFSNRSGTFLTIESATLSDFQGTPTSPGSDPWELEKQSRSYESRLLATSGTVLKIGAGSIAATGAIFAVGTTLVTTTSGYMGAGLAVASVGIALPAYAVGTVFANVHSKQRIEDEFSYRRLKLPLTLAPEQVAQGSLFFRLTPGPQRLVLRYRAGDEVQDVAIDLARLADLHLKNSAAGLSKSP
jgi:hypothetical protein